MRLCRCGCGTDLDRQDLRADALYASPACKMRHRRAGGEVRQLVPCLHCGELLDGRVDARFCSARCKMAYRRVGGDSEYALILAADPCVYCGAPAETIDHIEPISAGGVLGWENISAACLRCNCRKGSKPLLEFLCVAA